MLTKAQVLRSILKKRGYIVLWQAPYHPQFHIGQIVRELGGEGTDIGLFRVRSQTTVKDFLSQQILSKKIEPKLWTTDPTTLVRQTAKKIDGIVYWKVTRTSRRVERES